MNKKIFVFALILLVIIISSIFVFNFSFKKGLHELNVQEIKEKIDNKESFILCISATYCSHCKEYKPKLKEVSNKYKIDIYYIDFDKYSDEEQNLFRDYISFDGGTPVTLFIKNGEEKTTPVFCS